MTARAAHSLRILGAAALFSTAGAAIKACALTSWQVAGLRAGFASIAVLFLMPEARRRVSLRSAAVGVAYAVTVILFVRANKLTTAANAIFIQATSPIYILLLGPWLLEEKVRRRDLAFLLAVALGVALFFVGLDAPAATAPDPLRGNLTAMASGLASGVLMIGLRWLAREEHVGSTSAVLVGNLLAFAFCIPLALPLAAVRVQDLAVVAYLGVFQIGLAYALLTRAMTRVPALEASLLLFLEPVLSPLWAFLFHGERPGPLPLLGCGVILAATVIRTLADLRPPVARAGLG